MSNSQKDAGPDAYREPLLQPEEQEDVELQGLLSGSNLPRDAHRLESESYFQHDSSSLISPQLKRRLFGNAVFLTFVFAGLTLAGVVVLPFLNLPVPEFGFGSGRGSSESGKTSQVGGSAPFHGTVLKSNGTTEFRRTVLMVSIDGLRADYLDRGLTPHLLDISKKGLRAKYMKPIFPTLTFPNHWALMTGLYAESHGIVANNFWDPVSEREFHYNKAESAWTSSWWLGEPIWETAGKAGVLNANLMWPGPPVTTSGHKSTYFVPWQDKVPLQEKLDQIMSWIDLPLEERPQLILAYEPTLDQAGHLAGPNSKLVNETLVQVDVFAKDLHSQLVARNLSEIVDVIFVSDHGMTDMSHPELVYMDDFIGEEGVKSIKHSDGWPAMGLRFDSQDNASKYLSILLDAASKNPEKFEVYTSDTMPERFHFSKNERIAPIYVVPKIGYVLTTKEEGDVAMSKGNHGYDNDAPEMHAVFVAHGPFSIDAKDFHAKRSTDDSGMRPGWHSVQDTEYVMDGFENIEIYSLVTRLLGIEAWSARTNGTLEFWDKYL